jgi:galactoside O-acetyltransferase
MPNLTIKKGAAIGALSFVRENVEGWSIYGGNPLKFIKKRSQKILELIKNHEIN